ncbi:MAG TPA: MFS transporter [Flavisolibacter sp.]|nr:MFS transporter [Flavisolibacter sp.]
MRFTIILDFMVMSPLGDLLMKSLRLSPEQFATSVSAYAFSAGISGLLAAGFADKYDRKKLLIIFYIGFTAGTLVCGLAESYGVLLAGRIVTGLFGGVLGSVSMAIVTDLFGFDQRGRVMGIVQMAFAVSQVGGIPIGLYLANQWGWQSPFLMIVVLSLLTLLALMQLMRPVVQHLAQSRRNNPLVHLGKTISRPAYLLPFLTTALLSIGGFMLMPFSTPFIINNVGISQKDLPLIYVITGLFAMVLMPLIGIISDKAGKLSTFIGGTVIAMIMVVIYTNLTPVPLWQLIMINTFMFTGIMSRMIPSTALMTAIPDAGDRGSFMSVNSSLQQIAGGIASILAGFVIVREPNGNLAHFDTLGYLCVGVMILCAVLMLVISHRVVAKAGMNTEAMAA